MSARTGHRCVMRKKVRRNGAQDGSVKTGFSLFLEKKGICIQSASYGGA